MDQGSSLLLGIEGLVVDRVVINEFRRRAVHCSTDPELAGWCPACRQQSSSPKDRVITRLRGLRIGPVQPGMYVAQRSALGDAASLIQENAKWPGIFQQAPLGVSDQLARRPVNVAV